MNHAKIIGTGRYTPSNIVTNEDLSKFVETSDEWITTRTGIKERRISIGEDTSELCLKAAKKALENANICAEEIDLIIVSTVTPDQFTPSTSCLVQAELGAVNAASFDINAACTGFVYGLNIANAFIKSGQYKTILMIGAEVLSKVTNWEDRNTCVLFGDGAGAAVLRASDESGIITTYTGSEGDVKGVLTIGAVDVTNPYTENVDEKYKSIYMNGKEVFKFATKAMNKSVRKVIEDANMTIDDIDHIVPHQANYRIIDYVAQKNKIDKDKIYINLDKYGNTSSASIAIALDEMNEKGLLKRGDKIILTGFGGGLTWGAILLEW